MGDADSSSAEREGLQAAKAATLQELGIFIAKSAFALNSAAAIALIPLAGAILQSERREVAALASTLACAGWWFIGGALFALVMAIVGHFSLMRSWIRNKKPEGTEFVRALRASVPVAGFALPSVPFLVGISVILGGLADLPMD
mgnify:CR=1 FL=1